MESATEYGPAHDEVRAALESVFPVSMLSRFLTLQINEKQTQMEVSNFGRRVPLWVGGVGVSGTQPVDGKWGRQPEETAL